MTKAPLRIALLTGALKLGGSTIFVYNLAGELVKRRVPCLVISDEAGHPMAEEFARRGIEAILWDEKREIFEDRVLRTILRLREFKPDVVVASLAPFAFEVLRYVPSEVLKIGMVHSDDPNVYRMVEKYADCMDGIVGVSAVIVERLEKMDPLRRVTKRYVSCGVAMPDQQNARTQPSPAKRDALRILYLGRVINEQKRVNLFPQIAARLHEAGIVFHWTIAGDGPDCAALEAKMKSLAITHPVKFIGQVKYADISLLLNANDIFILVSDFEGLPLSLLEAMGHGLVPVVSDLESGIREIVNESNGMLVPVDDIEGYARAIIHLDTRRDELLTKSVAARERVRTEFSIESMTDRWLTFLDTAPHQKIEWPSMWQIRAPRGALHPMIFAKPFRALRRLRKWLTG